ncbi:MAG: TetR/AcrR family transcriptional regulator [Rhizomicrobium sp.]|jgi:AcrR family transcriptional regulator
MSHAPTFSKPAKGWTRRKQARPGEILEAAVSVFAEKGFAAARMEDIAARAGVTKGTIYLYFPSKEEVFKTLARETVSVALAAVAQQVREFKGPSRELLVTLLSSIAAFLQDKDRAMLPKIIISESGNFPELARFWRSEVVDKALAMVTGVITQGVAHGEFRSLPPEHVARLCVAPIILSLIWRTTFAPLETIPFDHHRLFATHLDVLLKGLEPEGSTK